MAKQYLLIDGYNLLYAAGLARSQYGPGEFQEQRSVLLQGSADRLGAGDRSTTTVVFDAQNAPPGLDTVQQFRRMSVVFNRGGDADSLIEELLSKHPAPKQVLVVSSDHRLQRAAARRRAEFVDSDVFWKREPDKGTQVPRQKSVDERLKAGELVPPAAEIERLAHGVQVAREDGGARDGATESDANSPGVGSRKSEGGSLEDELMGRGEEALEEWEERRSGRA